jgi:hypothetical protein
MKVLAKWHACPARAAAPIYPPFPPQRSGPLFTVDHPGAKAAPIAVIDILALLLAYSTARLLTPQPAPRLLRPERVLFGWSPTEPSLLTLWRSADLTTWTIYKFASRLQWLGTVKATDKRDAIEKAAKEFRLDPTKLMAERQR